MTIKINNLIKFYILFLLVEKPIHGYKVISKLKEKLDRKISANQVYPFLNLLKKNKFLTIKQKGEREKKVYVLTKKGKEFAIETINRFGELIDITMRSNLSICVHCGCKIYRECYSEKINKKLMIFCCKHCAKAYKNNLL